MDTAQGKYEFEGTMHNGEITELTIRPEGPPDNLIQH